MELQGEICNSCRLPFYQCDCNSEELKSLQDSTFESLDKKDCQQFFNDLEDLSHYTDWISSLNPINIDTSKIKIASCIGIIDELQIYLTQLKAILKLKLPKITIPQKMTGII